VWDARALGRVAAIVAGAVSVLRTGRAVLLPEVEVGYELLADAAVASLVGCVIREAAAS
jgi:hypothetical protein